jgi:membrane AbrB-like protein
MSRSALPKEGRPLDLILATATALAVALVFNRAGVPAGLVVGGMIGAAIVPVVKNREIPLPDGLVTGVQIIIGIVVGSSVTPESLRSMGTLLMPAVLSAVLIIVAGLIIARALHALRILPPWAVLATCPGALEALVLVAVERDDGAVEVALFHIVRVVLVLLSVPVLIFLLER